MADYMAQGWSGVPQDSATQKALLEMAARGNLRAATSGQGAPMRDSAETLADANHSDLQKEADPNDPNSMIQSLDKRADELEKEAEKVQQHGVQTGKSNFGAQQNYNRAAAILRDRARKLHAQWQASLQQQMQAQQAQQAQQTQQQQQTQQTQALQAQQQQAVMPPAMPR